MRAADDPLHGRRPPWWRRRRCSDPMPDTGDSHLWLAAHPDRDVTRLDWRSLRAQAEAERMGSGAFATTVPPDLAAELPPVGALDTLGDPPAVQASAYQPGRAVRLALVVLPILTPALAGAGLALLAATLWS
jgi:hypothetical protein